jgi:hypothetical protein
MSASACSTMRAQVVLVADDPAASGRIGGVDGGESWLPLLVAVLAARSAIVFACRMCDRRAARGCRRRRRGPRTSRDVRATLTVPPVLADMLFDELD